MLRELAFQLLLARNKISNKECEILAVNGNGTYRIRWRGREYDQVGSISGAFYRVGQIVPIQLSYGQVFLP